MRIPALVLSMLLAAGLLAAGLLAAGPVFAQNSPDTTSPDARQAAPDARKTMLDDLFAALKAAPDAQAAAVVEGRIRQIWIGLGSPAVLLLLNQAAQQQAAGDNDSALDTLDDALVLAPDYPEAWLSRAQAKFHAGDYAGAVRDLEATLQREPREFLAWQTLSRIAEAQQNWKGALAAWQKALEIDPETSNGQDRLLMLERKAFGEST